MTKKSKLKKATGKEKAQDAAAVLRAQVAKNIKVLRRRAGLTQLQLSQITKVSARYVAQTECAKGQNLTLDTLSRISEALNVQVVDLINGEQAVIRKKTDALKLAIESLQLYCKILETGESIAPISENKTSYEGEAPHHDTKPVVSRIEEKTGKRKK
jgi:transcriptional regulator with XRE-family HTH domain